MKANLIKAVEKFIGRAEYDRNMSATEYIDASFNDLWFSLLIAYIWILIALIRTKGNA